MYLESDVYHFVLIVLRVVGEVLLDEVVVVWEKVEVEVAVLHE